MRTNVAGAQVGGACFGCQQRDLAVGPQRAVRSRVGGRRSALGWAC